MPTKRPYKVGKVPKAAHQPPHVCRMQFWYAAGRREYFRCATCGRVQWYAVR